MAHPLRGRRSTFYIPLAPNEVLVARPTRWGNPYVIDPVGDAWHVSDSNGASETEVCDTVDGAVARAVELYRLLLEGQIAIGIRDVSVLRGKRLMCYCPLDRPCHADVLCELANREGASDVG